MRGALKNGKLGNWDFNMSLAITATTTTTTASSAALKSNWPTSLTNNYEQSEKTHTNKHTQKDEPKRVSCGPWSASAASSEEYRKGEVRQGRRVDMPQATV